MEQSHNNQYPAITHISNPQITLAQFMNNSVLPIIAKVLQRLSVHLNSFNSCLSLQFPTLLCTRHHSLLSTYRDYIYFSHIKYTSYIYTIYIIYIYIHYYMTHRRDIIRHPYYTFMRPYILYVMIMTII